MTALRALAAAIVLACCLPAPHTRAGFVTRVTWFNLSGVMANGQWVHDGAAACPRAYLGATVHVVQPDVWLTCEDTGASWYFEAGGFPVDVWAPSRPAWMADWMEIEVTW